MGRTTKRLIKRALAFAGYEVRRCKPLRKSKATALPSTADSGEGEPFIVEMIGPSGVGKTTLYYRIVEQVRKCWLTQDELPFSSAAIDAVDTQGIYGELLQYKINDIIDQPLMIGHKIQLIQFQLSLLATDVFLQTLKGRKIFMQDGICHNYGKELVAYFKSNPDKGLSTLQNRAIIRVTASSDFIIQNLKDRNMATPAVANDWWKQRNVISIAEQIAKYEANAESLLHVAEANHIPCVTVRTDKPNAASQVLEFVDGLVKS